MASLTGELHFLARLSVPILLAQIAQTSMGFVDTMVSGRAGTLDLAAVALGTAFWMPVFMFGQGVLLALMPLVSQLQGAGDLERGGAAIGHEIRQGIWLSLFVSVPLVLFLLILIHMMPHFGYDPALTDKTCRYLLACSCGLPGYMLFVAQRSGLDGLGRVRIALVTTFVGLVLNIAGNTAFVLGKWGFPAYGGVGAGIATAIVCWSSAFIMLVQQLRMADVRSWLHPSVWTGPRSASLLRIAAIGLPGAVANLCEVTMFTAVAILIAPLGALSLASNQIAFSCSSIIFMIPLSLSMATTIRVGTYVGAKSPSDARCAARAGLTGGIVVAACVTFGIVTLRWFIAGLFTEDALVAAEAASLLLLIAAYQFPDATQVVSGGVLRAYNQTRPMLLVSICVYGGLGLPLGYVLGRTSWLVPSMGAHGFWLAIILGMLVAAIVLFLRMRREERHFARFCRQGRLH